MTRLHLVVVAATLWGCHHASPASFDASTGGGFDAAMLDAAVRLDGSDASALVPLPDLRFKWVGASPSYVATCATGTGAVIDLCASQSAPLPLTAFGPVRLADTDSARVVDAGSSAWTVQAFGLATVMEPLVSTAEGTDATMASADLSTAITSGRVITSFDRDDHGQIGFTVDGPADTQAAYSLHAQFHGTRGQLDAFVLDEASQGSVVTALGPEGDIASAAGTITAFSFARAGNTGENEYEIQVSDATYAQLGDAFTALAQGGYIVTAMGRIDEGDYVLVGTHVPGQVTPRATKVSTVATGSEDPAAMLAQGYAIVGWAIDEPGFGTTTTLYEK